VRQATKVSKAPSDCPVRLFLLGIWRFTVRLVIKKNLKKVALLFFLLGFSSLSGVLRVPR
jgi:hypothetical protein